MKQVSLNNIFKFNKYEWGIDYIDILDILIQYYKINNQIIKK